MNRKKILLIGFGISEKRREAVSVNTIRLEQQLKSLGFEPIRYNIGYENPHAFTGKSMAQALLSFPSIIKKCSKFIKQQRIAYVTDLFVLPLSTLIFTLPLRHMNPNVIFIKEVHNDAGASKKIHAETLIRLLTNKQWMLNLILRTCTCFTRNIQVSQKYNIPYLPTTVPIHKIARIQNKRLRISYLGHPLDKKGIWIFPEIFKQFPIELKKKVEFNFAFSNIGPRKKVEIAFKKEAVKSDIKINFFGTVDPHIFFSSQDIYILPLIDHFSAVSTPNTILEAIEAGAIPIVTDLSSLEGIVKNMETAILIKELNPSEIIQKVKLLSNQPILAANLRKNGRKHLMQNFSDKKVNNILKEIYA